MSNKPVPPDFTIADLKKIADENMAVSKSFMEHRFNWFIKDLEDFPEKSQLPSSELVGSILNPGREATNTIDLDLSKLLDNKYEQTSLFDRGEKEIRSYIKLLESEKQKETEKSLFLEKQKEALVVGSYKNVKILRFIEESDHLANALTKSRATKVLLLTDSFYTRDTDFYRKITSILKRISLPFVEFTNVQPNLDRRDIFKMVEFVNDHEVNCILVIGSMSTVDVAKFLISKLLKPSIFQLHSPKSYSANFVKYSIFTIPTIVAPDSRLNSRSVINNKILFPKCKFFGNILFLKNEIDDADTVFYCLEIFDILKPEKLNQILHETFFRLIFNYLDLSARESLLDTIVTSIKTIDRLLEVRRLNQDLSVDDRLNLLNIISITMDGRSIVDNSDFWLWYKLEGALSFLVNSKKSDGLALFLPTFLEVLSYHNFEFSKRISELGTKLYGSYSAEGFIYKIMSHIKRHNLPTSLAEIPEVKKVDYNFLTSLIKRSSLGIYSSKFYKAIVKNLTIL